MAGEFVIVAAGLAHATTAAQPGGISVILPTFKLGSATGYTPDKDTDTDLRGTVLYTGLITGYVKQGDGSLLISCVLPASAGPFTFGEIGIYTSTGDLFALACLPAPVTKISSLNAGFGATYTYNGLLKLGSSATTIEIPGTGPLNYPVQYVTKWVDLVNAPLAGPQIYFTIVSEPDNKGDYGTAVRNATTGNWSIQSNYYAARPIAHIVFVSVGKSYLTISKADWLLMCPGDTTLTKATTTTFVIRAPNGRYCMASASDAGTNVQFTFNDPFTAGDLVAGQTLQLFSNYPL